MWDAYSGLEGTVKDTMTSLRAVAELQSPALRDRHWHQLMTAIGVSVLGLLTEYFCDMLFLGSYHSSGMKWDLGEGL